MIRFLLDVLATYPLEVAIAWLGIALWALVVWVLFMGDIPRVSK